MGDTNAATSHEQVVDVSRVKTTVGNRITEVSVNTTIMYRNRDERVLRELLRELLLGVMEINRPG